MTSTPADPALAGFTLPPGVGATILAIIIVVPAYIAIFVSRLVAAAMRMHHDGRLRHSWLAVLAPLTLLMSGYTFRYLEPATGAVLIALALCAGYVVMFRSGRGWFRWTAPIAVLPIALQVWL